VKILLVYPYAQEERLRSEDIQPVPIGLWYIGALLKDHGYDVEVLNWHDMKGRESDIEEALISMKPDVLGLSIMNANRWGGIRIAGIAKKLDPSVHIVFGGPCPTFLWEHFLNHFHEIDTVVIGEGERTFLQLVQCLEQGRTNRIQEVKGIALRVDGRVVPTPAAPFLEGLDDLPNPARYFTYSHVVSSRGCPGTCSFCAAPRLWGRRVRFHSPAYFVDQLELLAQKGIRFFYFSDDTFTLKKDHAINVCRLILERRLDIEWFAISRVDCVHEETLYWMRKAGCVQISYGVESGSERFRAFLKKNITREHIRNAFSKTVSHGILPRAYFIYGFPGETWDTIQETIDLIMEIKPLSAVFYILDLFPGTALYQEFLNNSGLSDDLWLEPMEDIMYWETDARLNGEQILAFGTKLRAFFHRALPEFAGSMTLSPSQDLKRSHADFLSRLGMTFSHGEYSRNPDIPDPDKTAESLFKRSLELHPNARAFLGIGMLRQKRGALDQAVEVLSQGLRRFPSSKPLSVCLSVSLMNMGAFKEALQHLQPFGQDQDILPYVRECLARLDPSS